MGEQIKRVFVYGTLKKGGGNHRLLNGCKFVGEHITENEHTMVDFGPFPAILEGGTTPITGEVYVINNSVAGDLDRLEGDPSMYQRKIIDTEYGKALVYYMKELGAHHKYGIIESGVWGNL